jgi:hypothetical protein
MGTTPLTVADRLVAERLRPRDEPGGASDEVARATEGSGA